MRSHTDVKRARRGLTLPYVVVLLATFIGMAAFAIDFSRMYIIHGQLETASEAGALAGTTAIIHGYGANAADSAVLYAQRNPTEPNVAPDVTLSDVIFGRWASGAFTPTTAWNDPNTNAVSVTTRHTGNYIFGPIYNIGSHQVTATAIAEIGSTNRAHCIRPIALPYQKLLETLFPTSTPPVTYDLTPADIATLATKTAANAMVLKTNNAGSSVLSGNYYGIDEGPSWFFDGTAGHPITSGAGAYSDGLAATSCSGLEYQGMIGVGDWVQAENGDMKGPTRDGLWGRCGSGKNAPPAYNCNPPVPFLVPIWDISDKSMGSPVGLRVKYLGVFYATRYDAQGIWGYFGTMSANGEFTEEPGPLPKAVLRR